MNAPDLDKLLDKLALCVVNRPEPVRLSLLQESILDNRLTDEEIKRGYLGIRDSPKPFWPSPGEFLAKARPPANVAAIGTEAETILQLILDHPLKYGSYNPETGTVYERRKIEAQHGRAASEAFGAVQGRIRTMETLADEKWVRVEFCRAYEAARADHGAPLTLTPPSNRLKAPEPAKALGGATEEETKVAEAKKRFSEMIHGPAITRYQRETPDWEARKAFLAAQAAELMK